MPVLNPEPVHLAIRTALALSSTVKLRSSFDRKHYLYPDLPAGYQITQKHYPLAIGGHILLDEFDGLKQPLQVRIEQLQLEQDTGKSLHDVHPDFTLLDLNRAGIGLMEIVTYPDIRSPVEAGATLKKFQSILRTIGSSTANMEEGCLRCDANVSVRRDGEVLGTKVEVKNLGTVSGLITALEYEIKRQTDLLNRNLTIDAETRGFDAVSGETFLMRRKETVEDYRYMPETDVPALTIASSIIANIKAALPELPHVRKERYRSMYGLSINDINVVVESEGGIHYFEQLMKDRSRDVQKCVNWMTSELMGRLKKFGFNLSTSPIYADQLGSLIDQIHHGHTSGKMAKQVLDIMFTDALAKPSTRRLAEDIISEKGWTMITDEAEILQICQTIIAQTPDQLTKMKKSGSTKRILGWYVGQVMERTNGLAHPESVNKIMTQCLEKEM